MTDYTAPGHFVSAHKRMRLSYHGTVGVPTDNTIPAPAYADHGLSRTKSSMPIRVMRRFTNKQDEQYDPGTIPLLSKREQRKAEKREQKKLEELQAYQRKQFHDQISRQLEVNQSTREPQLIQSEARRSVRQKVKDTLRRPVKSKKNKSCSHPEKEDAGNSGIQQQYPPHIDDFQNKNELRSWFHPSDVEARPAPITIEETFPAELPAEAVQPPLPYNSEIVKKHFDDQLFDIDTLPLPARSPSPCLSSNIPRRGITVSETATAAASARQMQCDYCHSAIRLTGFHYACNLCNGGDCIYCAKCANEGRTCRHELVERTRNIKRHPTNPQSERKPVHLDKDRDSVVSAEISVKSIKLAAASTKAPETVADGQPASSKNVQQIENTSPISLATSEDLFKEFETKRREQEIAYREKEVTLREREAMLREREAWTATRERDAALVQQLHAAAMLQQRAEVGSQFAPVSPVSQHSSYRGVSRRASCSPQAETSRLSSRSASVYQVSTPAHEIAPIACVNASEHGIRDRAGSSKRKATTAETKQTESASSTRKGQPQSRRTSSRRSNERPEQEEDNSEDSDASSPKRQKHDTNSDPQKLFACPYFKHDHIRYAEGNTHELHYRGCAGGLYRDISRVKQHLKRIHHRPDFYCRRCFEVFATNEKLQKHSSSRQGCDVRDCPYPEKLDETQQAKIHVKRPGKDPKDLWFEIFSIIFPGAPLPESPYIEQTQPKDTDPEVLEQFIELFNRRLDFAAYSQPWLASITTRNFLNDQMLQAMQEIRSTHIATSTGVPSVLVSPVSPPSGYQSRQSSNASRASSSLPQSHSLSPESSRQQLRPALKVSTSAGTAATSTSSRSPFNSAKSRRNSSFPTVAMHVQHDPGYDPASESWRSGDDFPMMNEIQLPEPSSATSTRSTKSVSWAPEPQQSTQDIQMQQKVPTLADFTNFNWSAQVFANRQDDMSRHSSHDSSPPLSSRQQQKRPQRQRADSAYGTLSSAQASKTSLLHPQFQQAFENFGHVDFGSERLTCVDPRTLFVDPAAPMSADSNAGMSVDLQAYLNRDMGANEYPHF